jgi:Na+-translocating ferredoxin:NAD+ oxidoreductase subunit B
MDSLIKTVKSLDIATQKIKPPTEQHSLNLIEQLDQILPQTQCQRCGYPACRPYAEALANGETSANRCPPGGQNGVKRLATLLGQPEIELDMKRGPSGVGFVVKIDQKFCIGCTKCIRACPVDAIIGANKRMHTIIPELCTGCELCIPPCPTDCITVVPKVQTVWSPLDAEKAKNRYLARNQRLASEAARPAQLPTNLLSPPSTAPPMSTSISARQSALEKALAQARQRLAEHSPKGSTS